MLPFIQDSILEFMAIFNRTPAVFVSDNATEYISKDMREILHTFQIQHQPRTPYHEQENGIAELINQTFMNGVRDALMTADLPPDYWHYALIDVVDKYNQLWHSYINKSPFMAFYGTKASNIEGLHIFGQLGHCSNLKPKPKLNPRAQFVR